MRYNPELDLFNLLDLFFCEINIDKPEDVIKICKRFASNQNFKKSLQVNIIKNEMFDLLNELCDSMKTELLKIPVLSKMTIQKFNNAANKTLPKIFARLSDMYTKTYYDFSIDIDNNNNEYLEIIDKKSSNIVGKVVGISLRNFVADINKALNNDVFLNPSKLVKFTISESPDLINPKTFSVELNLEEMISVINYYMIAINTKFSKAVGNSFVITVSDEDIQKSKGINTDKKGFTPITTYKSNRKFIGDDDNGGYGFLVI